MIWLKAKRGQTAAAVVRFTANLTACRADSAGRAQAQFPDPTGATPGVSGYLWLINVGSLGETWGAGFSIVDRVEVPRALASGDYMLSWRCAAASLLC